MKTKRLLALCFAFLLLFVLTACTKMVDSISINLMPTKTVYKTGETALDLSDGVITVNYNNGKHENVNMTDESVTFDGFNTSSVGQKEITLTYSEKTVKFYIYVEQRIAEIESISVKTNPKKNQYNIGNTQLDLAGGVLNLNYDDGTVQELFMIDSSVNSQFDFSESGESTVTLNCNGLTTSFKVTVLDKMVTSVEIITLPEKTQYVVGDLIDLTGGMVKLIYDDSSYEEVSMDSGYVNVVYNFSRAGKISVIVKYESNSDTYMVTVDEYDWSNFDEMLRFAVKFYEMDVDTPMIYPCLMLFQEVLHIYDTNNSSLIYYYEQTYSTDINFFSKYIFNKIFVKDMNYPAMPFLLQFTKTVFLWETETDYQESDQFLTDISELIDLYDLLPNFYKSSILMGLGSNIAFEGDYTAIWYFTNLITLALPDSMTIEEKTCYFALSNASIYYAVYDSVGGYENRDLFTEWLSFAKENYDKVEEKTALDTICGNNYNYYLDKFNKMSELTDEIRDLISLTNTVYEGFSLGQSRNEYSYYMAYMSDFMETIDEMLVDDDLRKIIYSEKLVGFSTLQNMYSLYLRNYNILMADYMYDYREFYEQTFLPIIRNWLKAGGTIYSDDLCDRNIYPEFDADMEAFWTAYYSQFELNTQINIIMGTNAMVLQKMSVDHYTYTLTSDQFDLYLNLYRAKLSHYSYILGYYSHAEYFNYMGEAITQYDALTDKESFDGLYCKNEYDNWKTYYVANNIPIPEDFDWENMKYIIGEMEKNQVSTDKDLLWLHFYFELLDKMEIINAEGNEDIKLYFDTMFGKRCDNIIAYCNGNFTYSQLFDDEQLNEFLRHLSYLTYHWGYNYNYSYNWNNMSTSDYEDIGHLLELYDGLKPQDKEPLFEGVGRFIYYFCTITTSYYNKTLGYSPSNTWYSLVQVDMFYDAWQTNNNNETLYRFLIAVGWTVQRYGYLNAQDKIKFNDAFGEMYNYYLDIFNEIRENNLPLPENIIAVLDMHKKLSEYKEISLDYNESAYYWAYLCDFLDAAWGLITKMEYYDIVYNVPLIEDKSIFTEYYAFLFPFQNEINALMNENADFYKNEVLTVIRNWLHADGNAFENGQFCDRDAYTKFDEDIELLWAALYYKCSNTALAQLLTKANYYTLKNISYDHYSTVLTENAFKVYTALYEAKVAYSYYMLNNVRIDEFKLKMETTMAMYEALSAAEKINFSSYFCKDEYIYWNNIYEFIQETYTLTVVASVGGTVDSEGGVYGYDQLITLTATALNGYNFDGWYINNKKVQGSTSTVYKFYMRADNYTVEARFLPNTYTLRAAAKAGGTVNVKEYTTHLFGTSVTVIATANEGYSFEGWYENNVKIEGALAEYTFTMPSKYYSIEARFTQNDYTLTASAGIGGSVDITEASYHFGDSVTLTATADSGYAFDGWYVNGQKVSALAEYTVTMPAENYTLEARFTEIE